MPFYLLKTFTQLQSGCLWYLYYVWFLCPQSSSGVSPPFPAEPNLTLSSTLDSDLSDASNLFVWANESGYLKVTSYTEAHLANRFVIHLTEGRTGVSHLSIQVNGIFNLLSGASVFEFLLVVGGSGLDGCL